MGTFTWWPHRDLVEADERLLALFGLPPDEPFSLLDASRRVHPEDQGAYLQALRRATDPAGGGVLREAVRILHPDGSVHWLSIAAQTDFGDKPPGTARVHGLASDVTEHKEAEEALQRSREQARLAVEVARLGTWTYDIENDVVRFDGRMSAIWGEPSEPMAVPLPEAVERIHPDDRPRVRRAIGDALDPAVGGRYTIDYRIRWPDGEERWLTAHGQAQFEGEGPDRHAVSFIGTALDITDRKRSEEVLRESEQRLRLIMDSMPQKVFTAAPDGEVDYVNPQWVEFTGIPFEELWEGGWVRALHPDDVEATTRAWRHSVETGEPYVFEHRFRAADGTYRWHISRGVPMQDEAGRRTLWIGANTDIHDLKEAEAGLAALTAESERQRRLYEAILSNTPDFAYIFDLDHRFTYANEGLLELWGKTWDEAMGRTCLELGYEPWHAEMHDREIEQVIATREPVRGQVPFSGSFGRRIYDYIFVPVLDADGGVEAVAGTTRDVTEHKQAEEALREADRRKDEFLAMLAHELRNPLAAIRNSVGVIASAGQGDAVRRAAELLDRQTGHMARLVDDLLDVSRVSRGKIALQRERVDLLPLVRDAVEMVRPLVEAKSHAVSVTVPPEPVHLEADAVRLAQVLENLLGNACKFTRPGGSIDLTVERDAGDAVIRVRDNGIGIAPEELIHIFEMFAQADTTVDRSQTGLGLGLTLVKHLVEMHAGTVEARSAGVGQGSEFIVRLPVSQAPASEAREAAGAPPASAARRVLVVDDNHDAADSLALLLELEGHDVTVAYDGRGAVQAAQDVRPELILLDIGMPEVSGYEVCRRIREQPWGGDIFIVAATGWGQEQDQRRSVETGFDAHLVKPIGTGDLQKLLASLA